jgi:hypothetical protein
MHQTRRRVAFLGSFVVALILAAGFAVSFGGGASAQDMTMSGVGHPAHVHEGLCPAPGAVVFPLTDVSGSDSMNGTPMAMGSMMGASTAIAVETSTTTIATSLASITDGNHSVVVHESAANIGNYIACGDIGGTMMGTSDLAIGLAPLNGSGDSGIVWLHDNGDGSTTVEIFLTHQGDMSTMPMATPMATPAS